MLLKSRFRTEIFRQVIIQLNSRSFFYSSYFSSLFYNILTFDVLFLLRISPVYIILYVDSTIICNVGVFSYLWYHWTDHKNAQQTTFHQVVRSICMLVCDFGPIDKNVVFFLSENANSA